MKFHIKISCMKFSHVSNVQILNCMHRNEASPGKFM